MLKAIVISNNIHGLENYYQSNTHVQYDFYPVTAQFQPDLMQYDLLVVPNGSDHIAMQKIKQPVLDFLNEGKALVCCDGWFTNWVPGNQWRMDNSKKSIDVRYFVKDDPHGLLDGLDIDEFIFSNGMSGYWACGYIEPAPSATVLLQDTWHRAIVLLDETTTKGVMLLTASGPIGDVTYTDTAGRKQSSLIRLYQHFIQYLLTRQTV